MSEFSFEALFRDLNTSSTSPIERKDLIGQIERRLDNFWPYLSLEMARTAAMLIHQAKNQHREPEESDQVRTSGV